MNPIVSDELASSRTPERTLWCSIFLTFIEDMNFYISLKNKVLRSKKTRFALGKEVLSTGTVTKNKYIAILESKIRALLLQAESQYIQDAFLILGLDHSSFLQRLVWQYQNNAKITLAVVSEKERIEFQDAIDL